jgi:hypothetical protein
MSVESVRGDSWPRRDKARALKWLLWLLPALTAVGLALSTIRGSLWVDELHTSWTLADSVAEMDERARAGNQSPGFAQLLRGLSWTLGLLGSADQLDSPELAVFVPQQEWWLRLPSVISLAVCIWIGCALSASMLDRWKADFARRVDDTVGAKLGPSLRFNDVALVVAAWIGWVALDQIQQFYGTEARVYGLLQLLTLIGWWAAYRLASGQFTAGQTSRLQKYTAGSRQENLATLVWGSVWLLSSVAAVHLHVISGLIVAWQVIVVSLSLCFGGRRVPLILWCTLVCICLLLSLPAALGASAVWGRRQMWSSFAGDSSLSVAIQLFPLLPILLPVVVGLVVDRGLIALYRRQRGGGSQVKGSADNPEADSHNTRRDHAESLIIDGDESEDLERDPIARKNRTTDENDQWDSEQWDLGWKGLVFWAVAFLGPWLTAWRLTDLGITPILHRRYVLGSAVPMIIFAVLLLFHIRHRQLRWAALLVAAGFLLVSQGTWAAWQRGLPVAPQRGEDWRAAVQWVQSRVDLEWSTGEKAEANAADSWLPEPHLNSRNQPELWCASGLIEGKQASLPMSEEFRTYLSFPLRGMYRVRDKQGRAYEPQPLLDDASLWPQQWGPIRQRRNLFLICRATPNVLVDILEKLGPFLASRRVTMRVREGPKAFGIISGVYLELEPRDVR